jgi:molecular chaperone DnaK
VTIHVLQGERKQASQNKSLGRFDLADIPPAPRGMPQVEVSFDIDANGILNVSAKDKATGKEQSIIIKASSGLSEGEIDKMVRDAEAHSEEDQKFEEMVTLRNRADGLIHAARKAVKDAGDKATDAEKSKVENAAKALEDAIKGDDKDDIEKKIEALTEASGALAQKMYSDASAAGANAEGNADTNAAGDGAVDAEFEEVKDDDKK